VAVKIKLKRLGKIRNPQYRIVVADARTNRDGRAIEEIGLYQPVLNLLKITGDWQKFKGEPGAEGTLRVAEPRADKKSVFEAAVKESMGDDVATGTATRGKKKAEPKKSEAKAAETTEVKSEG